MQSGTILAKDLKLYGIWMSIVALCVVFAVAVESPLPLLLPLTIPIALWVIRDYRNLFYLFFALVPFSVEYNFTPSLGTDLPSEPIMLLLFGIGLLLFFQRVFHSDFSKYFSPIALLLILHLGWLLTTTITSGFFILSLKIFLAKLWYVVPFYFMAIHILKERADTEKLIKYGVFMLALSIVIVLIRHARTGFAFEEANFVVTPIFRNHVNYACIIVVFLPYLWALYAWEKKAGQKLFYAFLIGLYITGTYFSYTRAAILSMVLAIIIYFIIKLRWVVPSIMITILVVVTGVSALLYNNNYMRMNPVYERTISHQRFDKLISATYKMEDISTMERVYRWVAGVQMIKDKPLMGFGPGTFYSSYSGYTVTSFQTYVSNNPDNSTVHNYYLLTFIEQGLIGFLIFISLCIAVLVIGERTYHRTRDPRDKVIVMAAMLSFCIILLLNTINDMIETDKVGPFFFLSMAIISIYHYKSKSTAESGLPERQ